MNLDSLPAIITLLIALSVATERCVEIVKGLSPTLDTARSDARLEGRRRAAIQALGVAFGFLIAWVTWPVVAESLGRENASLHWPTVVALGFLTSGGSGFWNSMLGYVTSLKELKKVDVKERTEAAGVLVVPQPTVGTLTP